MTSPTIETIDLTQIVGDLEVPCDYSERSWHGGASAKAEMAGHLVPCPCGTCGVRLLCKGCFAMLLADDLNAFECRGCDELTFPARHAFSHFEYL